MFDTVHARPGMPLGMLLALLTRLPARSVALVVPPVASGSALLEAGALEAVAARVRRDGKEVTIVGGSVSLRARAVLVGLMAATTLDDWRAACRRREADLPAWPTLATEHPPLHLLRSRMPDDEGMDVTDEIEVPAYVRALLPRHDPPIVVVDDQERLDEESSLLKLEDEAERLEEEIAARILATGDHARRDVLREGSAGSSPRHARSPWTRPLTPLADDTDGARSS